MKQISSLSFELSGSQVFQLYLILTFEFTPTGVLYHKRKHTKLGNSGELPEGVFEP